ncbi:uncharacterized protein LOC126737715 [Anthonomus grandis grandis]|uniref:uncharacterized protein LOC126737715 n=1 Tax=Anthonomus grandis grandis TaxID=2921223 RepID=UPI002166858B|nr:uncharacterized protein LOC126737715 [Anthonomus grandis grandis]
MDSTSTFSSSPSAIEKLSKKSVRLRNKSYISKVPDKPKPPSQNYSRNYRHSNCTPSTLRKVNNWISSLNTINDNPRQHAENNPCQSKLDCQIVLDPEYYYTEKEDKMLEDEIAQYCTSPFRKYRPHERLSNSHAARDYVTDLFDHQAENSNVKPNKRRRLLQSNMVEKEVDISDSGSELSLSPENEKKKELCSYLQLMKPSDKKTIMILQNRRSVRVKNLTIMQEKKELEKKLREESEDTGDNLLKLPTDSDDGDKRDKWLKYRGQQQEANFNFPKPEEHLASILKDFDVTAEDWFKDYKRQSNQKINGYDAGENLLNNSKNRSEESITLPLPGFSKKDIDYGNNYVKNIVNSTEELKKQLIRAQKSPKTLIRHLVQKKGKKSPKKYIEPDSSNNLDTLPSRANRYSIPVGITNGVCDYQEASFKGSTPEIVLKKKKSSTGEFSPIVEISAGIYDMTGDAIRQDSMLQADIQMKTKLMGFRDHPGALKNDLRKSEENGLVQKSPSFKIKLKTKKKISMSLSKEKLTRTVNGALKQKKEVKKALKKPPALVVPKMVSQKEMTNVPEKIPKKRTKSLSPDTKTTPSKKSSTASKTPKQTPKNGETPNKQEIIKKSSSTPKRCPPPDRQQKSTEPKTYSSQMLVVEQEPLFTNTTVTSPKIRVKPLRNLTKTTQNDSFIKFIDTTVSPTDNTEPRTAVQMLSDMNSPHTTRNNSDPVISSSRILAVVQYPDKNVVSRTNGTADVAPFHPQIINIQETSSRDEVNLPQFIAFDKETVTKPLLSCSLGSSKRKSVHSEGETGLSSWQTTGTKSKKDQHSIHVSRDGGPVLKVFYLDFNLILCQESLVSFWTQTALGNVLGAQNMWISKGSIQRSVNNNCTIKESLEMVVTSENCIAYVELWTKEHLSAIREGPVADIFAIVYFWRKGGSALEKKVLQLENINGFADDVQYSVLKSSPKIIVSWHVASNEAGSKKTRVHSHQLASDFQSVYNINEFEAVDHYVSSLHNIEGCETLIMGSGENRITLWNIEHGYVAATIEMSELRSPLATLWVKCDRGFLFTLQQCVNRELRLIAIHGLNHSWKKLASYVPPEEYDRLKSVWLENGLVLAFYEQGVVCWNAQTAETILEAAHTECDHISGKYLISINRRDQVNVRHAFTHLLSVEES